MAYLKGLGAWDEVSAGNNWSSLGAVRYVWREPGSHPSLPQILIFDRTVTPGERTIKFGAERRLAQFIGVSEITRWVAQGAPLPSDDGLTGKQ